MRVAYDENGYAYDVESGYYLTLEYDTFGNAYNAETGEKVEYVDLGEGGGTVYVGGGGTNWNQLAQTGAQAAVGIFGGAGQSGYYIPGQGSSQQGGYQTPQQGATVTGGVNRGGVTGGINLSTNTLMIGGLILVAFIFGSQRSGRR